MCLLHRGFYLVACTLLRFFTRVSFSMQRGWLFLKGTKSFFQLYGNVHWRRVTGIYSPAATSHVVSIMLIMNNVIKIKNTCNYFYSTKLPCETFWDPDIATKVIFDKVVLICRLLLQHCKRAGAEQDNVVPVSWDTLHCSKHTKNVTSQTCSCSCCCCHFILILYRQLYKLGK